MKKAVIQFQFVLCCRFPHQVRITHMNQSYSGKGLAIVYRIDDSAYQNLRIIIIYLLVFGEAIAGTQCKAGKGWHSGQKGGIFLYIHQRLFIF